jgi:hypothetical protein
MVERRLKQFPEAAEHLTKCVDNPPPGKDHAWLTNIRGEKAMARAEVGILTIAAPIGTEVTIDGEERGSTSGREFFLEPRREHRIDVRLGPSSLRYTLSLGRGTSRNLVVVFPSPPPLGDWVVFGGTVATGVLALGGGVLYAVSAARYAEAEHHYQEMPRAPPACFFKHALPDQCDPYRSAFNSAGTLRDGALVGWIAAGGLGMATVIYTFAKPGASAAPVSIGLSLSSVHVEGVW